jgi:hypothetical protein
VYYKNKILQDLPSAYFEGALCGYRSLITEEQRGSLVGSNCTVTNSFSLDEDAPVQRSIVSKFYRSIPASNGVLSVTTPDLGLVKENRAGLNMHVGAHIRIHSNKVSTVTVKYQWNTGTWQTKSVTIPVPPIPAPRWLYFANSFDISDVVPGPYQQRAVFELNYTTGGGAEHYEYYINALTVGQDAESMASVCLGLPSGYEITSLNGGPSTLEVKNGGGHLTAIKSGLPIHFGTDYATMLCPWIPEQPCLELKRSNFMGVNNANGAVTLEFWTKIGKAGTKPIRLVGPMGSMDGLYVKNTTLVLSIAGVEFGHDIGTIDYPMLVHWVVETSKSYVMVNGEVVIEVDRSPDTSYFSDDLSIGFYTDTSIHPVHISSVATYPYGVPSMIAKARFVAGQGTDPYALIADRFDGKTFSADFSTSKFATNLTYPDNMSYSSGASVNLETSDELSLSMYELPDIVRPGSQSWSQSNAFSRPSASKTSGNTTPLDHSANNTSGTGFSTNASMGSVYTSVANSSCTNTISIPANLPRGTIFIVSAESKYSGTTPQITTTINGVTRVTDFSGSNPSVCKIGSVVPEGTTSITWGVKAPAGTNFAQFSNVYCQFVYPEQPFRVKPTGFTSEPYLYWDSLNFLRGAAIQSIESVIESSGGNATILTVRKMDTQTALTVSISGTTLVYDYSDYTGSTILTTKTIELNRQFTIGIHIAQLLTKYPQMSQLFSQPASTEILFGGGEGVSFSGKVYGVTFNDGWQTQHSPTTFVDGIADLMMDSYTKPMPVGTYTLKSVTEFGNFTLDVASSGHWQETIPASLFTKRVSNVVGENVDMFDFIQATIGKTRPTLPTSSYEQITYLQLQQRYWAKTYADLLADYASYATLSEDKELNEHDMQIDYRQLSLLYHGQDYTNLLNDHVDYQALSDIRIPVYDPSHTDVQTWAALHLLTDSPTDYTLREPLPVDGMTTVYLDNDNKRQLIQDGYAIVVPYQDQSQYALTFYHVLTSQGVRSTPVKLKSFELTSWASDATKWTAIGTQEGNEVYPYHHNGSYYLMDYPNVFETTKRGFNYLYKSNRSGYKPKAQILPGYDSGFAMRWHRKSNAIATRQIAGVSMMLYSEYPVLSEFKVATLEVGANVVFHIYAKPLGSRYTLEARDASGQPHTNIQWYMSGKLAVNPMIHVGEWSLVQISLTTPYDTQNEVAYLRLGGRLSYDNITIHGRLNASVRGTAVYRRWEELGIDDWDYWRTPGGDYDATWRQLYDLGSVVEVDIERAEMADLLTGIAPQAEFAASVGTKMHDVFVVRDIEWAPMGVITK